MLPSFCGSEVPSAPSTPAVSPMAEGPYLPIEALQRPPMACGIPPLPGGAGPETPFGGASATSSASCGLPAPFPGHSGTPTPTAADGSGGGEAFCSGMPPSPGVAAMSGQPMDMRGGLPQMPPWPFQCGTMPGAMQAFCAPQISGSGDGTPTMHQVIVVQAPPPPAPTNAEGGFGFAPAHGQGPMGAGGPMADAAAHPQPLERSSTAPPAPGCPWPEPRELDGAMQMHRPPQDLGCAVPGSMGHATWVEGWSAEGQQQQALPLGPYHCGA